MSLERELSDREPTFEVASDDTLALAAKAGDHPHSAHARNTLYLRHLPSIKAMVARPMRLVAGLSNIDSSLQPDDVVQQTFLIFCDLLDRWHGNSAEEPFLSYMARLLPSHTAHFVRDTLHYRARAYAGRLSLNPIITHRQPNQVQQPYHQPSHLYEQLFSNISWHHHTRNLNPHSKRLITLRYSLRLTTAQIALLTGLSPRTIDRHLNAALNHIRLHIQATWETCA